MDEWVYFFGIFVVDLEFVEQFVVGGDVKVFDFICNFGGELVQVGIGNVGQWIDV